MIRPSPLCKQCNSLRARLLRRVAIFEKLATIAEGNFDNADLLQLYQAQALLDPPGVHLCIMFAMLFPDGYLLPVQHYTAGP